VTAANINDRAALLTMLEDSKQRLSSLKKMWADMGYLGQTLKEKVSDYGIDLEIVKRPRRYFYVPAEVTDVNAYLEEHGHPIPQNFTLLPKRWIVERTFAWIGRYRRMSKDYEFLTHTQESFIKLAIVITMLKKLL
jgi:putative transposase